MSNLLPPYLSRYLYKTSTSQPLVSLSFGSLRISITCILHDRWMLIFRWIGRKMRNSCNYTFCYLCKSMAFLYETWHSNNPIQFNAADVFNIYHPLFYIIDTSTLSRFLQRCYYKSYCYRSQNLYVPPILLM